MKVELESQTIPKLKKEIRYICHGCGATATEIAKYVALRQAQGDSKQEELDKRLIKKK